MKPTVNKEKCIGCGVCANISPECFELKNGKAIVKSQCKCDKKCKQAEEQCPVDAITV